MKKRSVDQLRLFEANKLSLRLLSQLTEVVKTLQKIHYLTQPPYTENPKRSAKKR